MKKYIVLITISINISLFTSSIKGAAEQTALEYAPEYPLPAENYLPAVIQSYRSLMRETPLTKELTTILIDFCPGIVHLIKEYAQNRWHEQTIAADKIISSTTISPDGNTIAV